MNPINPMARRIIPRLAPLRRRLIAVRTRSLASLTVRSGSPTKLNTGSPLDISASIVSYTHFDLNCGCSVRKVVKTGSGAALLREVRRSSALGSYVAVTVKTVAEATRKDSNILYIKVL